MRRVFKRFRRDERGVVALLAAITAGICMAMGAFAVDYGFYYLQSRKLQGMADLAALAAASDIDNAERAARRTIAAAGWDEPIQIKVELGTYTPDPDLNENLRFQPGGSPLNAARVTLVSRTQLFFGAAISGSDTMGVKRGAVAANAELAAFSMGTRLASVNGGIANQLLSALTGGHVNLSLVDYNGLVNADIDLISFVQALRVRMRLDGETLGAVLNETVDRDTVLDAAADILIANGNRRAASAMQHIANAARGEVQLNGLMDLGVYGRQDQASNSAAIKVSALDLVNGVLTVGGARDVQLNLNASVPKLAGLKVWLAIGERPNNSPWLTVSAGGDPVLHTAQMRLYVVADIAPAGGILQLAGIKALQLPITVELASADGRLSDISCSGRADAAATVQVRPSIGHTSIASIDPDKLDDFQHRLDEGMATLVQVPLVKISGSARIDVGGLAWKDLKFNAREIAARTVKTAQTSDIVGALTVSLLTKVKLKVDILGGGLTLGGLQSALTDTLVKAAAPIDDTLNALTDLLGLHLGEVDVWVTGVRCHRPALVL
jgi:uncharacterized membrane protein